MEKELLEKAHQAASLFLSDLREINAKTGWAAVEELVLPMIQQVSIMRRILGRLSNEN